MKEKNINYKIKSPDNKILDVGSVSPKTDGTFEFSTFAMDTLWKTDGNYIFSASIGSTQEIILIMYDNTEFKNLNLQTVVDEKVITLPVIEQEPVIGENTFYQEHEPIPLGIGSFVNATKDPQSYVDRYNNEPTYKEWFDENYLQYSSIYEAVGLEEPLQIPASFVDVTKDPQSYVDRYNNEPTYKEWFDENYSQYSSIYEAVELEEPLQIPASFVDVTKDPQSYVDRYNNEPTYKEWFDENYLQYSSIYEAVGLEEPEFGLCGDGTKLINGVCTIVEKIIEKPWWQFW